LTQFEIHGPQAKAIAEALLPGAQALAENHFMEQAGVIVWHNAPLVSDRFTVLCPTEQMTTCWDQAVGTGATPAGEAAYQMLRIAAGQPGEAELTEDYIPLESNLWSAVSFSK